MVSPRTSQAVLVTGASSGIGRATAVLLAERGWYVFAGVRRESDADLLADLLGGYGQPVLLDVTDSRSLLEAEVVVRGSGGLDALVNNAGIAVSAPLEYLPIADFRRQLEVNLTGQLAVSQTFLPLLRSSGGRIVFVGSISGRVANPLLGPYVASKFALAGLADTLRTELVPAGVSVSLIEPGPIATDIWRRGREVGAALARRLPVEARRRYGTMIESLAALAESAEARAMPPRSVAAVIHRALTVPHPKPRYLVGREAWLGAAFALLPSRVQARVMAYQMRGHGARPKLSAVGPEDGSEGVPPGDLRAVRP
jgi:NAD(P)-dependent dehydrogenase (short-subunit alcohol dehydrogenase family)